MEFRFGSRLDTYRKFYYISGSIFDDVYNTPILDQNITQYSMSLVTEEGDLIDLAQGVVNNSTSTFNQTITIPTTYAPALMIFYSTFDFYTFAPKMAHSLHLVKLLLTQFPEIPLRNPNLRFLLGLNRIRGD